MERVGGKKGGQGEEKNLERERYSCVFSLLKANF